jgi:peptide chain release factor 1
MDQKEQALRHELEELRRRLQDPDIFSSKEYPKLARRLSWLESVTALLDERNSLQAARGQADELSRGSDAELAELASAELAELEEKLTRNQERLSEELTPKDPNDEKDAVLEIRAAAGGDEASLFAGELYRMYTRWAETHDYKVDLVSESPSEAGGFKEVVFEIRGADAYRNLKFEAGVHRVQRVPVTESQRLKKRISR